MSVDEKKLPGDVWTVRSWGLAHHAGIVTYPHHDADGAGTFVIPYSGSKNWVCIKVKPEVVPRNNLSDFLEALTDPDTLLSDFSDSIDVETIHVSRGDLM